jgi:hypothetical protein
MKNRVFLGGTCANTSWRKELISKLEIDFFNHVVDDGTPECQKNEEVEKSTHCNVHLYIITKEMIETFSIAEAVDSACSANKQTIFHVIPDGFGDAELRSLRAVADLVLKRGGVAYIDSDLYRTATLLNHMYKT